MARPFAKIKYFIRAAILDASQEKLMKYKTVAIIREPPPPLEAGIARDSTMNITTWCCIKNGESKMSCNFEKNIYFPNESCKCSIMINNT